MLRLHDPDTGTPAPFTTASPGVLRLLTRVRGIRSALLGDLVQRVAEYHGLVVDHRWDGALPDPDAFNIRRGGAGGGEPDVEIGRTVHSGPEVAVPDADPVAVRFALLQARYTEPVRLTLAATSAAAQTLARWRAAVARWAESPSKPMCAEYVQRVVNAFDDDLDTVTALELFDALTIDLELPGGCKFETAAHLDRLFGLDLAADVGKY
ncbi:MAG: hypothetical protein ACJ73S_05830 [Mycobacteriales bacterium]